MTSSYRQANSQAALGSVVIRVSGIRNPKCAIHWVCDGFELLGSDIVLPCTVVGGRVYNFLIFPVFAWIDMACRLLTCSTAQMSGVEFPTLGFGSGAQSEVSTSSRFYLSSSLM